MTTKMLLSYDQLNPNCLAKSMIDQWQQSHGILDTNSAEDKVFFRVILDSGDIELSAGSKSIRLTPCEAIALSNIIQKLYNPLESNKDEK